MNFASLGAFALHLAAIEVDVEIAKQLILVKAALMVMERAQNAIGTYEFGWPPLKPETIARKVSGDTPLLETGALKHSIGIQIDGDVAYVGTNDPKAKYHEYGTSRIPPRPFLSYAAILEEKHIVEMAQRDLNRAFGGGGLASRGLRDELAALHAIVHAARSLGRLFESLTE